MGGAALTGNWHHGNAADDGSATRGWLLGHFIEPADDVRATGAVEVKWGVHPAGDKRPEWTSEDQRTTLLLHVEGHFRLHLTEGTVDMTKLGDYVVWGPGIDHTWEAITDAVVITVRWPSTP